MEGEPGKLRRMKKSVFCWEIDIQLNERNLCRGGLSLPGILLRKITSNGQKYDIILAK